MVFDLQRASMWKRISAGLLDVILLVILITGFAWIISLIDHYDRYASAYSSLIKQYEEKYQTSFEYSYEEYTSLSESERSTYDEAFKAFASDSTAIYNFNMLVSLTLMNITLATLLAITVLEVLVPLFLKNGQTIGKKIFSLGVMRTDGVRISTIQVIVRAYLGKFTIEIMIPILVIIMIYFNIVGLTGTLLIFGILALNVGLLIGTRTNSCIHDVFAVTVVIDLPSQMIFDSPEALIRYKEEYAAEKAAHTQY